MKEEAGNARAEGGCRSRRGLGCGARADGGGCQFLGGCAGGGLGVVLLGVAEAARASCWLRSISASTSPS